jgi:hypothetical protein
MAIAKETKETKKWEFKDRNYYLLNGISPITFTMSVRHSELSPLLWFDPELGYQRELRYATNQKSCFVDEQTGPVTLSQCVFEDGVLTVPKENQQLQKMLSIYHPLLNKVYAEHDPIAEAKEEVVDIETEIKALNIALEMDVVHAEAVLRVEQGSEVSKMSSAEIKRDVLLFAKNDPYLFLELVNDDNVTLRNFAIKAVEFGIVRLDDDQRTFKWAANGKKIMTVPFDEHPYSAMAAYFKTDEGLEVYKSIEKKIGV